MPPPRSVWSIVAVVLAVIAIGAGTVWIVWVSWSSHQARLAVTGSAEPPRDPPPAKPAALEVTSDKLHLDYTANEVAADQRYRERALRVTGAVRAIRRDVFDEPYLELWTTSEFETVDARFGRAWADELARINVGDHVAVQCIGTGMVLGSPRLRSCSVQEVKR